MMKKSVIVVLLSGIVLLTGCDSSSDDSDSTDSNTMPMTGTGTLDDALSRPADSRPLDDGLDQVNADLLTLFGTANARPVELDDDETVSTFVNKARAAR